MLGRYRRLVVALALAVASGLAVDAATAAPPPGTTLVAVARDLPAGHHLEAADLTGVSVPEQAVPAGAVPAGAGPADGLVGEVLAAPVRRGEVVTDVRLLSSFTRGLASGQVALPLHLADEGAVRWVRPGQRVSVLAVTADPVSGAAGTSDPADVVARDVVVLDVPQPADPSSFGAADPAGAAVVLLSVSEQQARTLAGRAAGGWLTVTVMP